MIIGQMKRLLLLRMTTPLEKMILPIKRFFFSGMGIMTDKSRAEIQYNIFKKMQ